MNLRDLFTDDKPVQTKKVFTATESVIAIQIKAGGQLKEHVTPVAAFLVCVIGEVIFENEKAVKETLLPGNYIPIEAGIKHWVIAKKDSTLVLTK